RLGGRHPLLSAIVCVLWCNPCHQIRGIEPGQVKMMVSSRGRSGRSNACAETLDADRHAGWLF
ncbi:hypothetical protein OAP54_01035, partial [Planktomarina temperata]|nr:hypothetical protein [Planktomarina temperata]